ncbi:BMP family ABC transporter substrate-binding protein [Nonomuraea antimicrobica]|uniref:BMP family ABC transporter substrate-binding protein n=1 Tax=Nonomuraea antimicrobica TaxID=561173 RepID=A0ABP7CJV6_9ACTN
MKINKVRAGVLALLIAATGTTLAGCGAPPASGGAGGAAPSLCMVTDTNGIDDGSFNELTYAGLTRAGGTKPTVTISRTPDDYVPNVESLVNGDCRMIVGVGFNLVDAIRSAAEANPEIRFAIVDDGSIDLPNVTTITFDITPAAFLAGYTAASYSTTGVVGTYGGTQIPPVTAFMDGFARGVDYFNRQNKASVTVVGWNVAKQTGTFVGGYAAGVEAKTVTQSLLDQRADVLMPVGGPIYQSAAEAIRDRGTSAALIGVDTDGYESDRKYQSLFLTSVLKHVDVAVAQAAGATGNAAGAAGTAGYVGTLANNGVGVAPFHDFADRAGTALGAELDKIRAGLVDGSIKP